MNAKPTSEVLKTELFKGLSLGSVLALVIPLIGLFLWPTPVPRLDADTQAYVLLVSGLKEGRYSAAKDLFDQAYSITDDAELRYLADFFSKDSQLALNAGVATYEEKDSVEGGVKAFADGFTKPLDSLSALSQLAKEWFGDFDKDCTIVDQRYQPRVQSFLAAEAANKNASHFNWWYFIGTPIVFALNALYNLGTKNEKTA